MNEFSKKKGGRNNQGGNGQGGYGQRGHGQRGYGQRGQGQRGYGQRGKRDNKQNKKVYYRWNLDHGDKGRMAENLINDLKYNHELFKQYCLVHHVTAYPLREDVLGAAMRALLDETRRGVCGSRQNIAFTTMYLRGNLISNARLVTTMAHEIGHNWGSQHDPKQEDLNCSPNTLAGGKFLMYWIANFGTDPNNHLFSSCSRNQIGGILKSRGDPGCFMIPAQFKTCGDGILQAGEQCDEGGKLFLGLEGEGCCTSDCTLKPNATCSTSSSPCCSKSCQAAPSTQECFPTDREINPCQMMPKCDGLDPFTCPRGDDRPDGAVCMGGVGEPRGKCKSGSCWSVCDQIGVGRQRQYETCHCTGTRDDMCQYCCRDRLTGVCESTGVVFPENEPCFIGTCHHGTCYTSYYTAHKGFRKSLLSILQLVAGLSMALSLIWVTAKETYRAFTLFTVSVHLMSWSSKIRALKGYKR